MRLFEILILLAFCLVFAKTDGKDLFDNLSDETGFTDDEIAVENLNDGTDMAAQTDSLEEDAPNVRRQSIRPPVVRRITVPISVPGNVNSFFFKICYCYRRTRCYVPGMRQGFHGWQTIYKSGYVVIGKWLYKFYRCDPRPLPTLAPTKRSV